MERERGEKMDRGERRQGGKKKGRGEGDGEGEGKEERRRQVDICFKLTSTSFSLAEVLGGGGEGDEGLTHTHPTEQGRLKDKGVRQRLNGALLFTLLKVNELHRCFGGHGNLRLCGTRKASVKQSTPKSPASPGAVRY